MFKGYFKKVKFNYAWLSRAGIGLIIFLIPLVFDIRLMAVFELSKILLFRTLVEILSLLLVFYIFGRYQNLRSWWQGTILFFKKSPIDLLVLVLWLVNILACLASVFSAVSWWGSYDRWLGLFTISHLFIFYFICRFLVSEKKQVEFYFKGAVAVSLLVSVYAIIQHFGIDLPGFSKGLRAVMAGFPRRSFSTLGHPNFLGAYLAIVFPLTLYLFVIAKKIWLKFFYSLVALANIMAVVFTLSRSVWLTVLLSIVFFAVSLFHLSGGKILKVLLFTLGVIFFVGTLYFYFIPSHSVLGNRLQGVTNLQSDTTGVRWWIWQVAWQNIIKRPILGYGQDTFYLLAQYSPSPFRFEPQLFDRAHNIFLDLSLTVGLVGLVIFLVLIYKVSSNLFTKIKKSDYNNRIFYLTIATSLLAYVLVGLFNFDTITTLVYFYFLIAASLVKIDETDFIKLEKQKNFWQKVALPFALLAVLFLIILGNGLPWRADKYAKSAQAELAKGDLVKPELYLTRSITLEPAQSMYYYLLAQNYYFLSQSVETPADKVALFNSSLNNYNKSLALGLPYNYYYQGLMPLLKYWIELDKAQLPNLLEVYSEAEIFLKYNAEFYRDWGIILYKSANYREAKNKLIEYLLLNKNSHDKSIQGYLNEINKNLNEK